MVGAVLPMVLFHQHFNWEEGVAEWPAVPGGGSSRLRAVLWFGAGVGAGFLGLTLLLWRTPPEATLLHAATVLAAVGGLSVGAGALPVSLPGRLLSVLHALGVVLTPMLVAATSMIEQSLFVSALMAAGVIYAGLAVRALRSLRRLA